MKSLPPIHISTLEDVADLEQTPLHEYLPAQNTYALFKQCADAFASNIALRYIPAIGAADISYTYADFFCRITQAANAFHALGITANETVSMLLPNVPQAHFTLWGGEAAGIVNPINPFLDIEHIAAIMRDTNSKVLVTLAPSPDSDLWEKATQLATLVPGLQTILAVDASKFLSASHAECSLPGLPDSADCQVLDFDHYIERFGGKMLASQRNIAADEVASYFHTGGTTGTPKLAPHTHLNEIVSAWQIATSLDCQADDVALCGLPLFHVNGVLVTGLAAFMRGAQVLLLTPEGYRNTAAMADFWGVVERYRVTFFSAVPAIIGALLNIDTGQHDISSLRAALCGAATLPLEVKRQFEGKTGLTIIEGYGQTEGTCVSTVNPLHGEHRSGSVGLRVPFLQVRVVQTNDQGKAIRDCDVNQVGNVAIKGPNVFSGYTDARKNEDLWVDTGWLNTGDLGRLDEDGYLWLTGRSKDLIIRGGHNIDPVVIEEALHQHPAVAAAAAVGKPDVKVGELPVAYVQLKEGQRASAQDILDFAAARISERAAVPKHLYFVDQLPLTAVGKVFKPDLRRDAIARSCRDVLAELGLSAEVLVEVCDQHGEVARISLPSHEADARAALSKRLAQYDFFHRIEV